MHHHAKVTSDNRSTRGIHPVVALASHQQNLGNLVQAALAHLPPFEDNHGIRHENKSLSIQVNGQTKFVKKPDFISVTRGPGMRSNLYTGLDTAKGLSIAWAIPLLAVNHMQAHALTPRLVAASLQTTSGPPTPSFPFLSLLVSGGHTMLLHSKSLNEHRNLAQTSDIAIGDAIDKIARGILPEEVLQASSSTMYGPVLEAFAFPPGEADYEAHREAGREANHEIDYAYTPPPNRTAELARYHSPHGWSFEPPLASTKSGSRNRALEFCFSGIYSSSHRIATEKGESMGIEERRHLARETMRIAFEHLATRVVFALDALREVKLGARGNGDRGGDGGGEGTVKALVVSGGVAANKYLKHMYVLSFSPLTPSLLLPHPNNLPTPNRTQTKLTKHHQPPRLPQRAQLPTHRAHLPASRPLHRQRHHDRLDWHRDVRSGVDERAQLPGAQEMVA